MSKLRIAVIFGGTNSEHEVSLLSAASVLKNLSEDKYDIFPILITKAGRWLYYKGDTKDISDIEKENNSLLVPAIISPDRTVGGMIVTPNGKDSYIEKIDVAFPVLHGKYGEDGTIQGLFALAGIPYIGSDVISSAVCMDKEIANRLFDHAGIVQAEWDVIYAWDKDRLDTYISLWERNLGYPLFVKPANAGSSVGVSKATDRLSLREGIDLAFLHDNKVIVEKGIIGREFECAVLGNNHPIASVLSEIKPLNEFYDYDAKYTTPSETVLPADISDELSDRIRTIAVKAYSTVGCKGMARVDFLYETDTDTIMLNEINTIPGFTSISMYARMIAESGIPYPMLLDKLIELALKRESEESND